MSSFFKKAMGLFVEFDDDPGNPVKDQNTGTITNNTSTPSSFSMGNFSQQEIEKFEKHFDDLFDGANLPGPDYFEFSKMMNMLEAHIPDESARMAAVYASLNLQGLTKEKIISTAKQYYAIIEGDKADFEKAAAIKAASEVEGRKQEVTELEKKISDSSDQIKKLTQDIANYQAQIGTLKNEMIQQEAKISSNKSGYNVACQAMLNKITSDIQKINTAIQ